MLTLLIVEGNTPETNRHIRALGGRLQSELFEPLLHAAGDVRTEVLHAADVTVPLPGQDELSPYDGILWTGSALNLHADDPAGMRQVELAQRALRTGAFVYGSCWGLQVVTAAAGGQVVPNPRGRELGVARDIRLTPAGRQHPLLRGRRDPFEALAVHRDIVVPPPHAAFTVLAHNPLCPVQAAELRIGAGCFWGVQYHPEYGLDDVASACRRYASRLVEEGLFPDLDQVEATARLYEAAEGPDQEPAAQRAREQLDICPELANPEFRTLEIRNWLTAARSRQATGRRVAPG